MAKDYFTVYTSFYDAVTDLTDEQLGRLFRSLFAYQLTEVEPTDSDIVTQFKFFKSQLNKEKPKMMVRYEGELNERRQKFSESLKPYLAIYGRDLLNDFYRYWAEANKSGTKMRMELEKTWSLEGRLETFSKNDRTFAKRQTEITLKDKGKLHPNKLNTDEIKY